MNETCVLFELLVSVSLISFILCQKFGCALNPSLSLTTPRTPGDASRPTQAMTHSYDMEELRPELLPPPEESNGTVKSPPDERGAVPAQNGKHSAIPSQTQQGHDQRRTSGALKLSHYGSKEASLSTTTPTTGATGVDTSSATTNPANVGSGFGGVHQ